MTGGPAQVLLVVGGIGLFLLGMTALKDGLQSLSGGQLRRFLQRSTTSPLRGAITGALATALIQSSSATVVIAVSFVSAGLLSFPQALGIVLGASVGTTVTGWLVAIVGFKLQLGMLAMPLVFAGALLMLFARARLRRFGWAIAGFGLLFIGIDMMKAGMEGLQDGLPIARDVGDGLLVRLQIVIAGIVFTVITQSSSAGVAVTLVALGTGSVTFVQAMCLVIGMHIGTTVTAALATIGGSVAARQTGLSQVLFNAMTGFVAFVLIDAYVTFTAPWLASQDPADAQIALVAFHTAFNVLGTALILPFTARFARMIVRLVPERGPPLVRSLDESLLRDPASAIAAARATLQAIARQLSGVILASLRVTPGRRQLADLAAAEEALETTRIFMSRIVSDPEPDETGKRHQASLHTLDHLIRLAHRCRQIDRIETIHADRSLRHLAGLMVDALTDPRPDGGIVIDSDRLNEVRSAYRRERHNYRQATVEVTARQVISADTALERLDAVRWLHRVSYHLWRIARHLDAANGPVQEPAPPDSRDRIRREIELEED